VNSPGHQYSLRYLRELRVENSAHPGGERRPTFLTPPPTSRCWKVCSSGVEGIMLAVNTLQAEA
jgi:hypothetical protein